MNIENIYDAVNSDEMNSPLITICNELIKQGYSIKIEGLEIDSLENDSKLFEDLEYATNEFLIELSRVDEPNQKYKVVFTGYHQFNLKPVSLNS